MKVKNKKSLIAIIIVPLLVIGITFAYFTTTSIYDNLFGVVDYNVITQEVFESPDDWAPGDTIPRSLTAKNDGGVAAAVRVKYTEVWKDENNQAISNVPNDAVIINFTTPSDWTKYGDYYYYNYSLNPNAITSSLITGVTLNPNLDTPNCVEANGVESCTSDVQGLEGDKYYLTFTIETVQYDKYQSVWNTDYSIIDRKLYTLPAGRTESNLQVGDEICVNGDTTECFNFYGYDGNNIKLLAKYNLKVGNIYETTNFTKIGEYTSVDSGYGLQSSDARGYLNSSSPSNGTVPFSATSYWNGISQYPVNIYDATNYVGAPNSNSYSVAYYVEYYKNKLEGYGVSISDARLLTYNETLDSSIGCDVSIDVYSACPTNAFITNTSFWLGTASDGVNVYDVNSYGALIEDPVDTSVGLGVRPVIVVAKSDVNGNYNNVGSSSITLPNGRTKDNLQVGDEICIEGTTTECFNFIKYDGNDVVMISKYNLNVGSNPYNSATGKQDSNVRGWLDNGTTYGDVSFSDGNYWYDSTNDNLKSKYGSSWNTNNIYDTDYASASGANYSIAYYVEQYKNMLVNDGASIKSARLLTYSEAVDSSIGCSSSCPTNSFITNTSYWLGSAGDQSDIWLIASDGDFINNYDHDTTGYFGVRPVIVISKSNM